MSTELRNFLAIPYDELEEMNLKAKKQRLDRVIGFGREIHWILGLKRAKVAPQIRCHAASLASQFDREIIPHR